MNIKIRSYTPSDLPSMMAIWNEVVEEGIGNHAQLLKAKALVEVSGMGIGTHHGIKLKNPEAVGLSLGHII